MNAEVNGKSVLFSESILFFEGDQVQFNGPFPLKVVTTDQNPSDIRINWDGASFVLSIDGMTPQMFDLVSRGDGHFSGNDFVWLARAQRVAETTPPMYSIQATFMVK